MLERVHLAIVHEFDRLGSLITAARALHVTQSALSHSVKKLEQKLGADIWIREGRKLKLTEADQYPLTLAHRVVPPFSLAEEQVQQFASGQRGTLCIGMKCRPCSQWLLTLVAPYLRAWPDVDVDVKQEFHLGGISALFGYEIDLLVTPDSLFKPGLHFEPVFDYEQVLAVGTQHPVVGHAYIRAEQLTPETLITHPVETERLDIYTQLLIPAAISPRRHKTIEATGIMLQMVASGRSVTALPRWMTEEYAWQINITAVRLGRQGIVKQIFLSSRRGDQQITYLQGFIAQARLTGAVPIERPPTPAQP